MTLTTDINKRVHFCAGLPRSGSTVLMNILQQHPAIFTTPTDPLPYIVKDTLTRCRYHEPFQAMDGTAADNALYRFVHGGVRGWYNGLTSKPVVISKNRNWPELLHLFPKSKTIALVRDLRSIIGSFDRVNEGLKATHTFNESGTFMPAMTDSEKFNYYFNQGNPLLDALQNQLTKLVDIAQKGKGEVIVVRFEDFVSDPINELKQIHEFLDIQWFDYDLDNIQQSEIYEHDHAYFRERTSHKVQSSLTTYKQPDYQMSHELQRMIVNHNKDFYNMFYPELTEQQNV